MIGDDIGEYSVFRLYHRIGEEIINNFDLKIMFSYLKTTKRTIMGFCLD